MMMVMMPVMDGQRTHRFDKRVAAGRGKVKQREVKSFIDWASALPYSSGQRHILTGDLLTMRLVRSRFLALALLFTLPLAVIAQKSAKPAVASAATPDNKLDINTATADQLKAFPGIGDAYSKRIVEGRPYTAKNQLVSRGVLPEAVYNKIKDSIIASKPATK
jgi:DNA uptake protein ComE-like DNA-binding protein